MLCQLRKKVGMRIPVESIPHETRISVALVGVEEPF
jgi:hypothetical protein